MDKNTEYVSFSDPVIVSGLRRECPYSGLDAETLTHLHKLRKACVPADAAMC